MWRVNQRDSRVGASVTKCVVAPYMVRHAAIKAIRAELARPETAFWVGSCRSDCIQALQTEPKQPSYEGYN